jgi:peptide/nickel transport system substrate-binding protein
MLVALLVGAAACSTDDGGNATGTTVAADSTPVDGGSLVVAVGAETAGWNPTRSAWSQSGAFVGSTVLEPMVVLDANADPQPWLATSWTPNDTYDEWTITLRPEVTFHNGEPFDATAVKANFDNAVSAPISGVAVSELIAGTTVIDPLTVRVDLTQPWAAFPTSFLAGQSATQMAPAMLASPDGGNSNPIGTGPFTFTSWTPDQSFEVARNPDYWRAGEPHLDTIEFRVLTDVTARGAALRSGEVDLILTPDTEQVSALATDHTIVKDWQTEPAMIMTNTLPDVDGQPNPMSNPHARLALAYATDSAALAANVGEGVLVPTSPFAPDGPWGQPAAEDGYVSFDQDKARAEIEAYKQDTGADSLQLTLNGPSASTTTDVLQLLQAQWAEVGIDAEIELIESSSLITNVVSGDYQAVLFSIYTSPEPDQYHYFWSAETAKGPGNISINFTQYTTPAMEQALAIGRENPDRSARQEAYSDLVREINAAAVNIWLFWIPNTMVADPAVQGLEVAGELHFPNFQLKTWWGQVWLSS